MESQRNIQDNTNENVLEKIIKKSDIKAKDIFDYEYLARDVMGLLPIKIEEEEEDIIMRISLEDMCPLSKLKTEEMEYRYRFLQNCFYLRNIWKDYDIPLEEDNIYYDSNFIPHIAFRDIRRSVDETGEEAFFEEYRRLTAGVLSRRYSYAQVRESGIEVVRKDKRAAFALQAESLQELYAWVKQKANEVYEDNRNNKIRLDKNRYQIRKFVTWGILLGMFVVIIYTGYQSLIILPRDKAVIKASRAYTVQDYVDCIDCLKKIEPEQMDTYTKYILAVSYAKSEALGKAELDNVLNRLSIYSNEIELEYWIAIGRSDYNKAENSAQVLSDDKLLIYAYMKELNYLEGNVAIDGEEKQSRMTQLSNSITQIGEKYMTDEE